MKLSELKAIVQEATQGEWLATFNELGGYDCMSDAFKINSVEQDLMIADIDLANYGQEACKSDESSRIAAKKNADYISTFNPSRILKLIELLEEAKEQISDYRNLLKHESYIFEEPESWLKSLEEFEK